MENENKITNDHDLLIRVDTRLGDLIKSVENIKSGNQKDIEDLQKRTAALELARSNQKIAMAIYIGIGAFLVGLMIYHIMGKGI